MSKRVLCADSIIEQYIALKRTEKAAADSVAALRGLFYEAMLLFPEGLRTGGAVIYSTSRPRYEYSRAIKAAEKKLNAMKAAFEKKNAPADVVKTWNVKL